MTENAMKNEFFHKLDRMRAHARQPRPAELATLAVECDVSVSEALVAIEQLSRFWRADDRETFESIAQFVETLFVGKRSKRVLEYSATSRVLSAGLIADSREATGKLVLRDTELASVLSVLLGEGVVASSLDEVAQGEQFETVICQPPVGNRSKEPLSDGFGGEVVSALSAHLSDRGQLFWLTARGVLYAEQANRTLNALAQTGLHLVAAIEVPPGVFTGSSIDGALLIFERHAREKMMVGALRDTASASVMADAFTKGATKKAGPSWVWQDADDRRNYSQIEREDLLKRIMPRGRHKEKTLSELITDEKIVKADKPISVESKAAAYIFIPEYAGSHVTAELDEQTVKPKAVYRVPIDTTQVNPRFLAILLNSPFGRELRALVAHGATIQRVSVESLKGLKLPLPPLETQDRIARIESDLSLLAATFDDIKQTLHHDWRALPELSEQVDSLKAVLDIEQQIENWWQELPYPLATIYRRYQIAKDPKERFDRLLHFFELAAVYLAAIGTSHVKALRQDWQEHFAKWFHPAEAAGIERADFGFWTALAGASLKDLARIASTKELREAASERAGFELVEVAANLAPLGKTTGILDEVRGYRNSWKGHGGHLKASDAARFDKELQQAIRDFYEATASVFRRLLLVRPGLADVSESSFRYQVDLLTGSDPAFETEVVEVSHGAASHALVFWMRDARVMCRALPFFRLGAPQEPQETSFYVFNRIENGGFRWISYQEAREQEFVAPDEELRSLIGLPRGDGS